MEERGNRRSDKRSSPGADHTGSRLHDPVVLLLYRRSTNFCDFCVSSQNSIRCTWLKDVLVFPDFMAKWI
jgi:hypothetical protein